MENKKVEELREDNLSQVNGGTNNSNLVMIFLFNLIGIGIEDNVMSYYNEHYTELTEDDLDKVKKRFKKQFGHNIGE